MPGLTDRLQVVFNQPPNLIEFSRLEAMIRRQRNGLKPELARLVLPAHVNVHSLVAVEAVEVEPVRSLNVGDSRHSVARHDPTIIAALCRRAKSSDFPRQCVCEAITQTGAERAL
jgi:hypothetical protein